MANQRDMIVEGLRDSRNTTYKVANDVVKGVHNKKEAIQVIGLLMKEFKIPLSVINGESDSDSE